MFKNYIFDLGQVMIHFDADYMTAAVVPEEPDRSLVSGVVFDRLYWDRLDDGSISDEAVKAAFSTRLPERLVPAACEVYDRWMEHLPPMEGMAALVADIKKAGGKLYLLSNVSDGFAKNYRNVPALADLLADFDGLVFSGSVGLVKPDAAIYEYLLETYDLSAQESVFVDDRVSNIAGAKAVGITGYLFDGNAGKLREYLGF